jgi:hypothetical protein
MRAAQPRRLAGRLNSQHRSVTASEVTYEEFSGAATVLEAHLIATFIGR